MFANRENNLSHEYRLVKFTKATKCVLLPIQSTKPHLVMALLSDLT